MTTYGESGATGADVTVLTKNWSILPSGEDNLPKIRPAVAGYYLILQALKLTVAAPATATTGTHKLDFIVSDGTTEINIGNLSAAYNKAISYDAGALSGDTTAAPTSLISDIMGLSPTNDVYLKLEYTNSTDGDSGVMTINYLALKMALE